MKAGNILPTRDFYADYKYWKEWSNFCRACQKEKPSNSMGYCQECNEELEEFGKHKSWSVPSIKFISNPLIRGMRISNGGDRQELCDEFQGEIDGL